MREVKRPVFSFRLNLDNPDHKKAWEILQSVPDGQKSSYLVQVILKDQENNQLEKSIRQAIREELAGVSISDSGKSVSKKEEIPSQALEHFLSQHPEITEIEVCTDNDFAGRWACEHIRKAYEGSYRIIENLPEIEGADWADMAKMTARTPEKRQRKEVR